MNDAETTHTERALSAKHILLGVSSGIAAYKAPMLVRALREEGAEIQVVLSANAHRFVSPMALQAVAGRAVRSNLWDEAAEAAMGHIELARWADLVLVAPTTANTLAKLVHGLADDLLTTVCLATSAPVVLAPAMNQAMYRHAATQRNLAAAHDLGYHIVGPDSGEQACGDDGPGRMTEPDAIAHYLRGLWPAPSAGLLAGRHVMVTAGPTLEAIDPVRFISNHSSGLQGLSIAEAAQAAGARVTLIAGPRVPRCSEHIQRIDVTSALDMHSAVLQNIAGIDIFVGVAAVADYRPQSSQTKKIKRSGSGGTMSLDLVENPDIIAAVAAASPRPLVVGFAAETHDALSHAREKRTRKGLDAIVVNDVSDASIGFNSADNAATLIYADGEVSYPKQTKRQLADALVTSLSQIFASQLADTNPVTVTK